MTFVVYLASGSHSSCLAAWNGYASSWRTFHGPAGGRQSAFRITGRPTACTWTVSGVWAVRSCRGSFHVSCGPSDAQGADHLVLVGFFTVPFTVWLPVLPFCFGACAFVGDTVVGQVNQSVGRSRLFGACVTGITFPPLSHVLMRHGLYNPPAGMMDSSECYIGENLYREIVRPGDFQSRESRRYAAGGC